MNLPALVDEFLPGPDGLLDRASLWAHRTVESLAATDLGRPVHTALHGNTWLGHPIHSIAIALPVGAYTMTSWYDARAARSGDASLDAAADAALRMGIAGSVVAVVTGVAQYLDTRDAVRRETSVHALLNNVALTLYVGSWAARKRGHRRAGRRLAGLGLSVVGVSGYLGGDLAFRHGVGVRPQAVRDPGTPAAQTSSEPVEAAGVVHV